MVRLRKLLSPLLICLLCMLLLSACGEEKVEFQGEKLLESTESITAVLGAEELAQLDRFPALKSVDLSGSDCYEEILAWAEAHPQVSVRYTVAFPGGSRIPWDTEGLSIAGLDREALEQALALSAYLPRLRYVDLGDDQGELSLKDVLRCQADFPELEFAYRFHFLGQELDLKSTQVDLRGLRALDTSRAQELFSALPELERVLLGEEEDCSLSWEQILRLRQAAPQAAFDYHFSLYGRSASLEDRELDLSRIRIRDDGELLCRALNCWPSLEKLTMDSCGLGDERMIQIRDQFPDTEVIWRIWFASSYSVRTDVEKILASKPSEGGIVDNREAAKLAVCTKLKYLDLGHNEAITDLSFLSSMPDLEVLIIAMNPLGDLSPLADCPHLEYLEMFFSDIDDLSPLAQLHELKHLNIGMCDYLRDVTPLYGLTQLERLYIGCQTPIPEEQLEELRERLPDCEINTTDPDTSVAAWRYTTAHDDDPDYMAQDYYRPGLAPRFALLRQQFGYDTLDYSFAWKDPTNVWYN